MQDQDWDLQVCDASSLLVRVAAGLDRGCADAAGVECVVENRAGAERMTEERDRVALHVGKTAYRVDQYANALLRRRTRGCGNRWSIGAGNRRHETGARA